MRACVCTVITYAVCARVKFIYSLAYSACAMILCEDGKAKITVRDLELSTSGKETIVIQAHLRKRASKFQRQEKLRNSS